MVNSIFSSIGNIGGATQNMPLFGHGSTYSINNYQQNLANVAQAQGLSSLQGYKLKDYMIDGIWMEFDEFVQAIYPEDTPERTMFLLKHQKQK